MSKHLEITGVVSPPGVQPNIAPRLEAHELVKDEKLFSLYVQAIKRCQENPEDLVDSYFQIAGIHGLPYVRWDGAGAEQPVAAPAGYCQHLTTIFSTWHRPYCALYEQTINRHATDIAAEYKVNREAWQKAAANLRLPHWDWALHALPPKQFYDHKQFSQLTITLPDGSSGPIDNPLLGYQFQTGRAPKAPGAREFPLAMLPRTIRHPPRKLTPDSVSNIDSFESGMGGQFKTTRRDVANLFEVKDWFQFGTQAAGSGSSTNSLEAIHGTLHGLIGGQFGGHMSYIPYAAFDPIFWLHHCNVDRVLALWQAIYDKQWITPLKDSDRTWVTDFNTLVNENTPLAPFWNSQSGFWNSTQCRDWTVLRYTYPDFDGLPMTDAPAVSKAISQRVRDLYNDRNTFPGFPSPTPAADPAFTAPQFNMLAATSNSLMSGAVTGVASALTGVAGLTSSEPANRVAESIEWTIRIRCKQSDLLDISSIPIFLGGIPDNEEHCLTDERLVGAYYPFVNPYPKGCRNCVENEDIVLEGFIHITASLIQRSLDVMDVATVEEYLKKNLKWAIRKNTGGYGRVEDLKSLEVTVIDTPLFGPEGAEVPVIGGVRKHNEVTFDKPGGRVRVPGHA